MFQCNCVALACYLLGHEIMVKMGCFIREFTPQFHDPNRTNRSCAPLLDMQ